MRIQVENNPHGNIYSPINNSFIENPQDLLLKAEKQRIIWEEIQNLHPMKTEHAVPGVPTQSFQPENDTLCKSDSLNAISVLSIFVSRYSS